MRQRLPFILTGLLVIIAIVVVAIFFTTTSTTTNTTPSAGPTLEPNNGSEIPAPSATPTVTRLGADSPPLLTGPLPPSASATDELVAGFPNEIISLPPGTTVINSAVATEGLRMQATVVATSTGSETDVSAHFDSILTALGLTGAATPSETGSTATAYSRGADSITVSTWTEADVTNFSILALITAAEG